MTDWDDGDAAALRAALAAVEDWDGDLGSLCGFSSDYSSGSDVGLPKKPRTRQKTAPYKLRKQEIEALRAEVDELENAVELEKVLIAATKSSDPSMEETALQLEWERLAATQKHEQFVAQMENTTLRKLLQSQRKNAERILSLTKRVKLLEEALPVDEPLSFEHYRMPYVDTQAQLERLDEHAPHAVEIFSSGVFAAEGRQCFREVHFNDTSPAVKGVDFDIEAAWVLPFPVDRVADAMWLQVTRPSFGHKTLAFMDVYEDASSLVSQFVATASPIEEWGATHGQIAVKRLPTDPIDGSILIGVNTKARAYVGSKWTGSALLDGWLQIKSIAPVDSSQPLTQVKWHRHVVIDPSDNGVMTHGQRSKWTHRIISGPSRSRLEKDLDWNQQQLENLLLTPEPKES